VQQTGSTNDDLARAAADGEPPGAVLIADLQTAGRGRRSRSWVAPPGAGLTMSVVLDTSGLPPSRLGWAGFVAGLALADGVRRATGINGRLKWPNDLLIEDAKVAGLLATAVSADRLVLGFGLNVTLDRGELPRADATSLLLAGADRLGRAPLAAATLDALGSWWERWRRAGWDPVAGGIAAEYRARCATLGRTVRAELPGGDAISGLAGDIAPDGSLVVDTAAGRRRLTVADVSHLRTVGAL
jgi:BirA family biotin operon repressor/biotin-[acetyl-CoA-carboxylase] ligase